VTTKQIAQLLKDIKEEDVMDFGENYEGQNVFAVRVADGVACVTLNSFDNSDLEWE
jgi:hypothetical protein